MRRLLIRFLCDRRGATAIEYGLIVALLSVVVAGAVTALGSKLYTMLSTVVASVH